MHFPPKQWRSIFLGFKITADDDCSHEIKRHVLLGRKTVTNVLRVLANLLRLCLTLCNPMDCNPTDSSARGISQARILGWVAMPSSRGSFWPRDQTPILYVSIPYKCYVNSCLCAANSNFVFWNFSPQIFLIHVVWIADTGYEGLTVVEFLWVWWGPGGGDLSLNIK